MMSALLLMQHAARAIFALFFGPSLVTFARALEAGARLLSRALGEAAHYYQHWRCFCQAVSFSHTM